MTDSWIDSKYQRLFTSLLNKPALSLINQKIQDFNMLLHVGGFNYVHWHGNCCPYFQNEIIQPSYSSHFVMVNVSVTICFQIRP